MKHTLCCLLFCLLFLPGASSAGLTGGCHCFRNRSYDAADTFSADGYLLTTTYNSLIAAVFDVSKGWIIMKKMKGGIRGNDLLIGLYISAKSKKPVNLLLSIRDSGGSWKDIVAAPGVRTETAADPILASIAAKKHADFIAGMITDYMLRTYYSTSKKRVKHIRSYSLNDKEISLLFALHQQTGTAVKQLVKMYERQKMSWSKIAHHYRLTPAEVGKNILKNQ